MSDRFPGGFITKTPPVPTKASASGVWTVEQALEYQRAGNWPYTGPTYIEDVFSPYLYTGNGTTQTINNGIDLSTYGGLTWIKDRSVGYYHRLADTVRGAGKELYSNDISAEVTNNANGYVTSFNSTGFSLGAGIGVNQSGTTYASWTLRKQPKFFDVVTYTGNGVAGRQISHSLGSNVGCLMVKCTSAAEDWQVWHRTFTGSQRIRLNLTDAVDASGSVVWNGTAPTSTVFTVGDNGVSNGAGRTYVAYLFAHDAGGFGLTGTDNVISCGTYAGNNSTSGPVITLGWEPQFVMIKKSTGGTGNWFMLDNMRGIPTRGDDARLYANLSNVEDVNGTIDVSATGFQLITASEPNTGGCNYIYIAIRRGPMKAPTTGTTVYNGVTYSGNGSTRVLESTIVPDVYIGNTRTGSNAVGLFVDRMRGSNAYIQTYSTAAESLVAPTRYFSGQTGFGLDTTADNVSGRTYVSWFLKRAPKFFDVVCYTGTGGNQTIPHSLGVAPELIIEKCRNTTSPWYVYAASQGATKATQLNSTPAFTSQTIWNNTSPTSSVFSINGGDHPADSTYVAYLFASCPGVSKVGSYSGTGSTINIDCGFTTGARLVLIRRSNSTGGDWWIWDTARGMVSGTSPYLLLNSTLAENNSPHVYTTPTGFQIVSTASDVNVSGGSYIFLAIA